MNQILPSRKISEDSADITLREYLCKEKGWNVAFYSPPCGSWSNICLEIEDFVYQSFSSRDASRPDIIFYKIVNEKINFIIIESKESIQKFTKENIVEYIKNMKKYANEIIKEKHRLVFNKKTKEFFEDIFLPMKYTQNYDLKIGFLICSEDISKDEEKFKDLLSVSTEAFGLLVEIDWERLKCRLKSINDNTNQFQNNLLIKYSY